MKKLFISLAIIAGISPVSYTHLHYTLPDGKIVPNNKLTIPSALPRRYAYCSDTIYLPRIIEQIYGVDLLFHEATFAQSEQARAKETLSLIHI